MKPRVIIGPPGTGKTHTLAGIVADGVRRYGLDSVRVVSMTRAAAAEAGERMGGAQVSTVHALCYRLLDMPEVFEGKWKKAWNAQTERYFMSLRETGTQTGDLLLSRYDLLRARREPVPEGMREFVDEYEAFKSATNTYDFTDMIEVCLKQGYRPEKLLGLYVDEAQDLSRLELDLLDAWAVDCDEYVRVGDPAQAIYGWRGSAPDAMESDSPEVLAQSHRVPRAVHARAVRLIRQARDLPQFDYAPTESEGKVVELGFRLQDADDLVAYLDRLDGETMILCYADYMLTPLIAYLREHGVPYGNRFSPKRWNPLARKDGSTLERLISFLRAIEEKRPFTIAEMKEWLPLTANVLRRGAKARWEAAIDEGPERNKRLVGETFRPEHLAAKPTVEWLEANLNAAASKAAAYPLAVYRARGLQALLDTPRLTVGTIHSVKGGEADHVIVCPDLPPATQEEFETPGWHGRDAVLRTFYVAVTRSKHGLYLLTPQRPHAAIEL